MKRNPMAPRITVELTQEAIDDGISRDSGHCMFAEAIKASFPQAQKVSVDLQTMRFSDLAKGYRYTYLTPRIAQLALLNYDHGTKPEPFSFQLRNGHVTRAGSREKRRLQLSSGRAKAKIAKAQLSKATLVVTKQDALGGVPRAVGGKTPPTTPFARRRAFGLRAIAY